MDRSLDLGMLTTTGFRSPPDKSSELSESTEHGSKSITQIPILHINREQGTSILGDNMDENKVLVCYPNPYHILAGLSSSTQKQYHNHSTIRGYQGIINQVLVVSSICARNLTPAMHFLHTTE
jgi:hypothetical protein